MSQSWRTERCVNHDVYPISTQSILSERLSNGFSLFEVLVSLLLLTSISLAVLKQQWKSNQFFTSFIGDIDYLLETDNQHESEALSL